MSSIDSLDTPALESHARLTVKYLERFQRNRGWSGLKEWERKLLHSAYEALDTPVAERMIVFDRDLKILTQPRTP